MWWYKPLKLPLEDTSVCRLCADSFNSPLIWSTEIWLSLFSPLNDKSSGTKHSKEQIIAQERFNLEVIELFASLKMLLWEMLNEDNIIATVHHQNTHTKCSYLFIFVLDKKKEQAYLCQSDSKLKFKKPWKTQYDHMPLFVASLQKLAGNSVQILTMSQNGRKNEIPVAFLLFCLLNSWSLIFTALLNSFQQPIFFYQDWVTWVCITIKKCIHVEKKQTTTTTIIPLLCVTSF